MHAIITFEKSWLPLPTFTYTNIDEETGNVNKRYLSASKSRELASAEAADNHV